MILITSAPIAYIKGALPDGQYVVKTRNGKMFLTKKSVFTKPPTEKQLAARQLFAERSKSGYFKKMTSKTSESH